VADSFSCCATGHGRVESHRNFRIVTHFITHFITHSHRDHKLSTVISVIYWQTHRTRYLIGFSPYWNGSCLVPVAHSGGTAWIVVCSYVAENDRLVIASRGDGYLLYQRQPFRGSGPATVHRRCYVLRRVVYNGRMGGEYCTWQSKFADFDAAGYWVCLELWGRNERAIKTSPPTSRISMTIVSKRLVG
jgi:hypothetical protein